MPDAAFGYEEIGHCYIYPPPCTVFTGRYTPTFWHTVQSQCYQLLHPRIYTGNRDVKSYCHCLSQLGPEGGFRCLTVREIMTATRTTFLGLAYQIPGYPIPNVRYENRESQNPPMQRSIPARYAIPPTLHHLHASQPSRALQNVAANKEFHLC